MTFHKKDRRTILAGALLGAVSGLLSFAFLAFLNFMIGNLLAGQYTRFSITHGLIFALIIVSYIWARRSLSFKIIRLSQAFFWKLRLRVLSIVLKSDFQAFTQRRDQVHSVLVHDVGTLTQASLSIIEFITSSVVVLACFIYMGLVSIPLFLVTIGTATLGILIYQLGTRVSNRQFEASRDLEDGFMRYFNAVLQGFKEIHMDGRIGQSIYRRQISPIAEGAYQNNTRAFTGFLNNQITGQVLFYALIASILLFFSVNLDIETGTTVNFLFILLYLLSSLETIMVLLPALARARISLGRIRTLQAELQQSTNEARTIMATTHPEPFTGLEVSGMTFSYPATEQQPEGFSIGPANLAIEPGQINFIYGGNGSGKTTFMHSFLGLLRPNEGTITFNGRTLADENYGEYKRLFSVVFNDFYLFDQ
ncbi:MAG TPA: hypothetical protein DCR93_10805, partial [Cytophagales bacterium]|nr:hypothetical protein [Cytophagales bacterium]